MGTKTQSFENHAKMVPGYHYVTGLILLVLLAWSVWRLIQGLTASSVLGFLLLVALVLVGFYARTFPLGVQDRLIRLEERLRMERLLPEDLQPRIGEFTTEQLIGIRFASDEELPELARRVLDEGIADRKTIKAAVRSWRADHQRI
jgi:hypothetical protein